MRPRIELRSLGSLDLGAVTGWAFGRFAEVRPAVGRWELPRTDPDNIAGARVAVLENTLILWLDEYRPSVLITAEPFKPRNIGEAIAKFSLLGVVMAECWRRRIRCMVQPEQTVRKEMLGRGTGPTDQMKALSLAWAARQGIAVADDNEAEAAIMWRWARDELANQYLSRGG